MKSLTAKLTQRPLAVSCMCFVVCAVTGYFALDFGVALAAFCGGLSVASFILYLIFKKRAERVFFTLLLCSLFSFAAFLSSHMYFGIKLGELEDFYGREVIVQGYVREAVYTKSYGASYYIMSEKIDSRDIKAKLILETEAEIFSENDTFIMTAVLEPFEENVGGYSERVISMSDGQLCSLVLSGDSYSITGEREKDIFSYINDAREWSYRRFSSLLDKRSASLFTAAFVGEDRYVSDYDMLLLRRSGTTHILAVSGTHFTVIMAALMLFLMPLGLPIKLRNTVLVLAALLYTAFTGFSPSVVRSAIMLTVTYTASTFGKSRDIATSLFLTMAAMIFFFPYLVLNAAFWLSCVATLGIVLCLPLLSELFGREHKSMLSDILRDSEIPLYSRVCRYFLAVLLRFIKGLPVYFLMSVIVSLFACALAMPVSLVFFGSISLAAIPSGLIMSPVASGIIVFAPFVLLLGKIPLVSYLCGVACDFFYCVAKVFSDIDGIYMNIDYTAVKIIVILYLASVAVLVLFSVKSRALILASALLCILCAVSANISEAVVYSGFHTVYNSEKDADMLFFKSESGLVAVDMGSTTKKDIKMGISASGTLRENEISAYVITDIKQKHIALIRYLCSNCKVKTLYLPDCVTESKIILTEAAEREAEEFGVEVLYFNYGQEFLLDGSEISVSGLEYISRSSLPLYAVSMKNQSGGVMWVSSSYFERKNTDFAYSQDASIFVFGTYGAKITGENKADIEALGKVSFVLPSEQIFSSFSSTEIEKMKENGLYITDSVYFYSKN